MKDKQAPTMADVAKEAGVALGTVSKVVNGQPVGDAFREKVKDAIARLGYQYNSSGRALRTNRTNTIALIIPNTINPYFALLVHHINLELEKRDYRMLLCYRYLNRKTWEQIADLMHIDPSTAKRWHTKAVSLLTLPDDAIWLREETGKYIA